MTLPRHRPRPSFAAMLGAAATAALLGACSSTPMDMGSAGTARGSAAGPSATGSGAAGAASGGANAAATRSGSASGSALGPNAAGAAAGGATAAASASPAMPSTVDAKGDLTGAGSVYFDFDEVQIKPEFTGLLERHGRFLLANPRMAVRIEGNADERGSAEYNLALGQRRADAVRSALRLQGVKDNQLEAVSWGEERLRVRGGDEAAHAQNRRADIQYPAK